MIRRILLITFLAVLTFSCASKERVVYFQGINSSSGSTKGEYQPKLQPDDLLFILVSASDPEAAIPYNLITYSSIDNEERVMGGARYQTYLIDSKGNIDFPVLGTLKLGGLTRNEAIEKIKSELKKYLPSAVVNLRLMNFKFSVMGEVVRPSTYNVATERVTLLEALSMAGDLTIYGDRKNVLIIREVDGVLTHNFIDLTSADFMNSEYYYLDQNDQIYVHPNQTKVNSSVVGPNITVGISALSLLITIFALITR